MTQYNIKFPIMEEHLDIESYLEYQRLVENSNGSYEELNKFFKAHNLPTTENIKNQKLRMDIGNTILVKIYDVDKIKKMNAEGSLYFE